MTTNSSGGTGYVDVYFSDVAGNADGLAGYNISIDLVQTSGPAGAVYFDTNIVSEPAQWVFNPPSIGTPLLYELSSDADSIVLGGEAGGINAWSPIDLGDGLARISFVFTGEAATYDLVFVGINELTSNLTEDAIPGITWQSGSITVAPEPATFGLLGLGGTLLALRRRRQA